MGGGGGNTAVLTKLSDSITPIFCILTYILHALDVDAEVPIRDHSLMMSDFRGGRGV